MKKKTFLLFLWLLLPLALVAQVNVVVVETTAGERMEYSLSSEPRIVYDGSKVTLFTNTTTVNFSPEEVEKVYMAESSTNIHNVKDSDGSIRIQHDRVCLSGYAASEPIMLFTIDGRQLQSHRIGTDGRLTISLSQLPSGIYIIKTRRQSVKITKK